MKIRSAGLRAATGPRFGTCVRIIVLLPLFVRPGWGRMAEPTSPGDAMPGRLPGPTDERAGVGPEPGTGRSPGLPGRARLARLLRGRLIAWTSTSRT